MNVVAFFQPGWADWEAGPVLALLREHFGAQVRIATPDGRPQTSIGGVSANADASFHEIGASDAEVFLAIGSDRWPSFEDEAFFSFLSDAVAADAVVGLICAGTVAGARAGLFSNRAHTSNGREWLLGKVPAYAGANRYVDGSRAVTGGRMVTASGLAPFTFASAIARLVAPDAAPQLDKYDALYSAEWSEPP